VSVFLINRVEDGSESGETTRLIALKSLGNIWEVQELGTATGRELGSLSTELPPPHDVMFRVRRHPSHERRERRA
jgi:hypothetical protein